MAGVMIEIATKDDKAFRGYLAIPPEGSGPGIVLLQEIYGLNQSIRAAADLFAEEGYVVLAPDLFWRLEEGVELSYDDAGSTKGMALLDRFDVDQAVADIGLTLNALRARPEVIGKTAAVGFCLGGLLAYLSATRLDVDAAIGFYGGGIAERLDEAANVTCPMTLHFGGADDHIPPAAVEKIREAFAGRIDVSVFVYPEAKHGFYLPGRSAYDRPIARLAHSHTIGLLRQILGPRYDLSALWERHCELEFDVRNAEETMTTMVAAPYVNHIPTMTGGVGYTELLRFYKNHFIARLPKDTKIVLVSRTIGPDRLVDELIFCFTHDTEVDFLLPGVPPTGKYVEAPTVAVVQFRGNKLCHEHIYWDQASILAQIGLLDETKLPVVGADAARKLRDETLPSNTKMERWKESG